MTDTDLVTGAFGYTGSRIAQRMLERGRRVCTLTRRDGADLVLVSVTNVRHDGLLPR